MITTRQKSLVAVALFGVLNASAMAATPSQPATDFTLQVAHINDTHSNFDPVKSSFTLGKNGERVYNEFGGYPRVLAAADKAKAAAAKADLPILFLHAGDAWQGSAYFKLNDGQANADLLSRMGLDAMALGNHEFDLNTAKLAAFINKVNFPVLAANMDVSADAPLRNSHNLKPYQLFAFNGDHKRKIGSVKEAKPGEQVVAVIGVVLEDMPTIANGVGKAKFLSEVKATQQTVDALTQAGVNKILVLSHIGNAKDVALAEATHGVDAIIGGHSHTLLGDFTDLGHGNNGPYAQMVPWNNQQGETCIVQAGQYAQALGQVSLAFDSQGELLTCKGHNTLLSDETFFADGNRTPGTALTGAALKKVEDYIEHNDKITEMPEDQALRQRIDSAYKPAVEQAYGHVLAHVPAEMKHMRRPGEKGSDNHGSDVAALVTQGLLYWANQPAVKAATGKTAQIAMIGAGGIRTDIAAGDFRTGNATLELLPFSNFPSELTVSGKTLRELLTQTINATLPEGAHAGKFPYVAGMRYTFIEDVKHQRGHISQLDFNAGTVTHPKWEPMQDDRHYVVVLNNYNASGNDGWKALGDAQLQGTDRVDIVKTAKGYKAYGVDHLTYNPQTQKFAVVYKEGAPACSSKGKGQDICNADALAVADYAAHVKVLKPLPIETVTVDYLK
ncbi:bifunctional metallophosphatase/5'-nucleotidase [Shewanella sp. NFH-SH190041]|uniref:bifunctional metallophosphatase/5'-nucleotidase n=1 Tax=Shewanella sp. NFH-SH190041 TaxID=2950245 RepID=UPI0021C414BC|nr:bifunctional metallophosphatase/5'-nucleotidase [Shewanella sp. NFH-SH190041]BDM63060.1 bifunctional metallophosphatase/5'-nucleotidase [Shewanella sp. NFH-SH190041]